MKLNKKILAGFLLLIAPIQKSFALSTLGWIVLIQSVAAGFVMSTLGTGIVLSVMLAKIVEDAVDFEGIRGYGDWELQTTSSDTYARNRYDILKPYHVRNTQYLKNLDSRNTQMLQNFNDMGKSTHAMYLRRFEDEENIGIARGLMSTIQSDVLNGRVDLLIQEDLSDFLIDTTEGAGAKLTENKVAVKSLGRNLQKVQQSFVNIEDFYISQYPDYKGTDGELVLRYCPSVERMSWRPCPPYITTAG